MPQDRPIKYIIHFKSAKNMVSHERPLLLSHKGGSHTKDLWDPSRGRKNTVFVRHYRKILPNLIIIGMQIENFLNPKFMQTKINIIINTSKQPLSGTVKWMLPPENTDHQLKKCKLQRITKHLSKFTFPSYFLTVLQNIGKTNNLRYI